MNPGVRMAGGMDPATKAMLLSTILGANAVSLAGLVDLGTGSANAFNSGELPLNLLLSMAPGAGAVAGVVPAALASPAAMVALQVAAHERGAQLPRTNWDMGRNAAMKFAAANPSLNASELAQKARIRGGRILAGSALAGSLATGIPALLAMRDAPLAQEQGVMA